MTRTESALLFQRGLKLSPTSTALKSFSPTSGTLPLESILTTIETSVQGYGYGFVFKLCLLLRRHVGCSSECPFHCSVPPMLNRALVNPAFPVWLTCLPELPRGQTKVFPHGFTELRGFLLRWPLTTPSSHIHNGGFRTWHHWILCPRPLWRGVLRTSWTWKSAIHSQFPLTARLALQGNAVSPLCHLNRQHCSSRRQSVQDMQPQMWGSSTFGLKCSVTEYNYESLYARSRCV